jgi:hypothetical protein
MIFNEVRVPEDFSRLLLYLAPLDLDETAEPGDAARFLLRAPSFDLDKTRVPEDCFRLLWCPVFLNFNGKTALDDFGCVVLGAAPFMSFLPLLSSRFEGLVLDFEATLLNDVRHLGFASSFFLISPLNFLSGGLVQVGSLNI